VERPPRMFGEPGQHLRMFIGGIIVEDGVDYLAGRDGPLDGRDEADELLMPMARHAAADDLAFEHAERGELGRRAVAFVIVREGCAFPPLQRKTRLGPVERLDLAFLVDGGLAIIAVVAEQQRGDMRPRAFRIRPADDSELAPVEPFGFALHAALSRRIRHIDRIGDHTLKTKLASVLEDEFAVACVVTVEPKAGLVCDQWLKERLALDQRQARDVPTTEM
jgi:hypothetical protein